MRSIRLEGLFEFFRQLIDLGGQDNVAVAQTCDVVGGERNVYTIVHIEPLRVVIHLRR